MNRGDGLVDAAAAAVSQVAYGQTGLADDASAYRTLELTLTIPRRVTLVWLLSLSVTVRVTSKEPYVKSFSGDGPLSTEPSLTDHA